MNTFTITRENKMFHLPDGGSVYRYEIKQTDENYIAVPHSHYFYYDAENGRFANAFSFYGGGSKKRKLSEMPSGFPESEEIWHPTIREMLLRHRKYVTEQDDFSKMILDLASSDSHLRETLRPVLADHYVSLAENVWESL
jgi:hypothetical protein